MKLRISSSWFFKGFSGALGAGVSRLPLNFYGLDARKNLNDIG